MTQAYENPENKSFGLQLSLISQWYSWNSQDRDRHILFSENTFLNSWLDLCYIYFPDRQTKCHGFLEMLSHLKPGYLLFLNAFTCSFVILKENILKWSDTLMVFYLLRL